MPFIIFVKGTAVMPPYVILSVSEVSTRFFTAFRMTVKCAKRKSCAFGTTLRSRRMTRVFVRNDTTRQEGRNRPDLNATARIERAFGLFAFS